MAGFEVRLVHAQRLKKKLRILPRSYRGATRSAMSRTLKFVEREAKANAPVLTGELRDKIEAFMHPTLPEGTVEAWAEHATFVHAGTTRMPARPFLFNAFEASRGDFRIDLPREINRVQRKVARR